VWRIIAGPTFIYMLLFNCWLAVAYFVARYNIQRLDYVWIGIIGTLIIFLTLLYSLRKRLVISYGRLKLWLSVHVWGASIGAFMVLFHSEMKFNALVPTLAFAVMEVVVLTGVLTRFAFMETARSMTVSTGDISCRVFGLDDATALAALAVDNMRYWRLVHLYATWFLLSLLLVHVFSEFYFRGLRL